MFVAVGYNLYGTQASMSCVDGVSWAVVSDILPRTIWRSVCYGNGQFVAFGQIPAHDADGGFVMTSPDGANWTVREVADIDHHWQSSCYGAGLYVAVSGWSSIGYAVITSPDGVVWTKRATPTERAWYAMCYGNGIFVSLDDGGYVAVSSNGIDWTIHSAPESDWQHVTYAKGLFVACAYSGLIMTSPNGVDWTTQSLGEDLYWDCVHFGGDRFVLLGDGIAATSFDGLAWSVDVAPDGAWDDITYNSGLFVATSIWDPETISSTDGINWTVTSLEAGSRWLGITSTDEGYIPPIISVNRKELYLARLQSTKNIEETGLDANDFIEVLRKSSFNIIAEYDLNNTLSGGTGENCVTQCGMRAECSLSFKIRSFGISVPDWCLVAQSAGLHYAIEFGIKTLTIQPIMSVQKDLTVWHYDEGCLKKAHNLMFDWEIIGEANKPCLINFNSGVGCISTLPIDGFAPAVVKNGSRVKTFTGASCVVLGSSAYQIVSFKFNSNNKLQQKLKCVTYGYGESVLVNREISFEIVAYTELPSVVSPYSAMMAGLETEVTFVYGDVNDPITITTQHANIQTVKETSNNGIRIWTISGIITNDDFALKIGLPV